MTYYRLRKREPLTALGFLHFCICGTPTHKCTNSLIIRWWLKTKAICHCSQHYHPYSQTIVVDLVTINLLQDESAENKMHSMLGKKTKKCTFSIKTNLNNLLTREERKIDRFIQYCSILCVMGNMNELNQWCTRKTAEIIDTGRKKLTFMCTQNKMVKI